MLTTEGPDESPQGIPLLLATELQDHLMTASNDLERLQRLLSDTCDSLMQGFHGVAGLLGQSLDDGEREADLGTQHLPRLRSCADQLARDALYDDADGEAVVETAPLRPNPVTQDEMDAGSVELF